MKLSSRLRNKIRLILLLSLVQVGLVTCKSVANEDSQDQDGSTSTKYEQRNATIPHQDKVNPVHFVREDYNDTSKYLSIDDMIITKDPSRAGLLNAPWPNAIVPFTYALTVAPQQRMTIAQAMGELSSKTCVQFRPARNDDTYWLLFQNDPLSQGCSSFVGWQNRRNQPVQLSAQCSKGNAVHEIIHALGFFHEHTRNDRDEYVRVKYENIKPGIETNFKKENEMDPPPETSTYEVPYNYDSIMHYGKDYFTKNGQPTVEPLYNRAALGSGDNIGQRDYLSEGDLAMLKKKYNCQNQNPDDPSAGGEPQQPQPQTTVRPPPAQNPACQLHPGIPFC